MQGFLNAVTGIANESGFVGIMENPGYLIMIIVACGLIYLAIGKQFEPLLLLPIAFGMLLANLPFGEIIHMQYFIPPEGADPSLYPMFSEILHHGGLADMLYLGVKLGIYPPLIFLGIGTMTDFGPLISNPKSLLLGAAAQLGIFTTYIGAKLLGFTGPQAGAIGIIGGADGPTAIFVASKLAPELLGAIAVAAYSYMALVPIIQPPIMRALTTKKERMIVMEQLRPVSKLEKIMFPIICTIIICLILPTAVPLVGMLMLGNLMKESGCCGPHQQDGGQRADEYHYDFPRRVCRMYHKCRDLPQQEHAVHRGAGPDRVLLRHCGRCSVRQNHVLGDARQGESADRFCRCFRCSDGRTCFSEGRPAGKSPEFPAYARHGAECCGRNRQRCGRRYPHQYVEMTLLRKKPFLWERLFLFNQVQVCYTKYDSAHE